MITKIFELIFISSLLRGTGVKQQFRQDICSGFTPRISRKNQLKYIHLVTAPVLCPEAED